MAEPPVPTAIVKTGAPDVGAAALPPPAGATVVPTYALYSRGQVGLATFLTGPIAGGWMLAQNWKRLDEPRKSRRVLIGTIALTVGLFALGLLVQQLGPLPLGLAGLAAIFGLAAQQRYAYDDHVARGGRRAGNGRVVAIGAISAGVTVVGLFAISIGYYFATLPPQIDLGHDHTVRYLAGGTEAEARALGKALEHDNHLPDHPASYGVRHNGTHHVIEVVVKDHLVVDDRLEAAFRLLARDMSRDAFHDEPVDVWLDNDEFERQHELVWSGPAE